MARQKIPAGASVEYDEPSPSGRQAIPADAKVEFDDSPAEPGPLRRGYDWSDPSTPEGKEQAWMARVVGTPDNRNPLEKAWAGMKGAGQALMPTKATAKDPGGVARAAKTGLADAATLGILSPESALENAHQEYLAAHSAYAPVMRTAAPDSFDYKVAAAKMAEASNRLQLAQADMEAAQAHPGGRLIGSIVAPGVGKAVGGAVGGVLPVANTVAGRIGKAIVSGAAGGAAEGGLRAGAAGEDMLTGALEGGVGGAAMALPIAGAGEAGRAVAQKAFPWVRRYAEAADAGRIAHAKELPQGRGGVQAAAGEAVDAIRARQLTRGQAVGEAHGRTLETASPREADLQPAADRLNDVREGARYESGDVIRGREGIDNAARDQLNNLYASNHRTVGDLVESRRAASEAAGWGAQNPSEQQLANREIYRALNDAIGKVAPDVRAADAAVASNRRGEGMENRIVFGKTSGGRSVPDEATNRSVLDPNDRIKASARLARIFDETEPGTKIQAQLEVLAQRDPVFKEAIDRIVAKKALEETRFGLHGQGAQVALHGAAGAGSLIHLAAKNVGALARQADQRVLSSAQSTTGAGALAVRIAAAEATRERDRRRAKQLRGQKEPTP